MDDQPENGILGEDWRAALKQMKSFIDITEQDLEQIYEIALAHARQRLTQATSVSEIMTVAVATIGPDEEIHQAALMLAEHGVSGLPVVDQDKRVLGVVTEADILANLCLHEEHSFRHTLKHLLKQQTERPGGDTVAAVMSAPAIVIGPKADIREVAKIMTEQRVKRLPVVDRRERLIGIVSRGDIIRAINRDAV